MFLEASEIIEEWVRRTFTSEKLPRNVQLLASHNNDLLTIKELLSYRSGQTTKEMSLAIDNDLTENRECN